LLPGTALPHDEDVLVFGAAGGHRGGECTFPR
jgi:hypothetical protein